jgi:hypothetical protein
MTLIYNREKGQILNCLDPVVKGVPSIRRIFEMSEEKQAAGGCVSSGGPT